MAVETTINLTTVEGVTSWIPVGECNKLTCEIVPASGYTWSSAVVDLEWVTCTGAEDDRSQTYSPAVQMTTDAKYLANVSVTNRGYIRFKTSTGEGANDPAAKLLYLLS